MNYIDILYYIIVTVVSVLVFYFLFSMWVWSIKMDIEDRKLSRQAKKMGYDDELW